MAASELSFPDRILRPEKTVSSWTKELLVHVWVPSEDEYLDASDDPLFAWHSPPVHDPHGNRLSSTGIISLLASR